METSRRHHDIKYSRGTSLIRNSVLLGPYSRPMPRTVWSSRGEGVLVGEVPL